MVIGVDKTRHVFGQVVPIHNWRSNIQSMGSLTIPPLGQPMCTLLSPNQSVRRKLEEAQQPQLVTATETRPQEAVSILIYLTLNQFRRCTNVLSYNAKGNGHRKREMPIWLLQQFSVSIYTEASDSVQLIQSLFTMFVPCSLHPV